MNSHSPILVQISGGCEAAKILDWVQRGCEYYMKSGGGALSREMKNRNRRMTPEDKAKIHALHARGLSTRQIERETGWSDTSVLEEIKRGGVPVSCHR